MIGHPAVLFNIEFCKLIIEIRWSDMIVCPVSLLALNILVEIIGCIQSLTRKDRRTGPDGADPLPRRFSLVTPPQVNSCNNITCSSNWCAICRLILLPFATAICMGSLSGANSEWVPFLYGFFPPLLVEHPCLRHPTSLTWKLDRFSQLVSILI